MDNVPHSIIFDFDYTLADSSVPVIDCINFALRGLGLPEAEPQDIRRTIGVDLYITLRTLSGEHDRATGNRFLDLYMQRADEVMLDGTIMLDSVPGVVRELARSRPLGIVSSKNRTRIEAILRREGLLGRFQTIVGGEDVPALKPDPAGLRNAVEALGSPPTQSLYISDSVTDAETARRAGVPFVAVLSGVTARAEFAEYPVVGILDDILGLPAMVAGWSREHGRE